MEDKYGGLTEILKDLSVISAAIVSEIIQRTLTTKEQQAIINRNMVIIVDVSKNIVVGKTRYIGGSVKRMVDLAMDFAAEYGNTINKEGEKEHDKRAG